MTNVELFKMRTMVVNFHYNTWGRLSHCFARILFFHCIIIIGFLVKIAHAALCEYISPKGVEEMPSFALDHFM